MGLYMSRLLRPKQGSRDSGVRLFHQAPIHIADAEDALSYSLHSIIMRLHRLSDYCVKSGRPEISDYITRVTDEMIDIDTDIDYYAELVFV